MYVKNQKFLVLGVSKSGYSVGKYLLSHSKGCYFFEQMHSEKIDQSIKELTQLGGVIVNEQDVDSVLDLVDAVVISPGVPINHSVSVKARQKGVRILGELEFGFSTFNPTTIAVTGTNGKTTTCCMIDHVLNSCGISSELVGNVGEPITNRLSEISLKDVCVSEVSSFQLESIFAFCPHVSCILNVAPDHLERHYTMDNYVFLKKRIFKNQRESEYCVLNYDDQTVKSFSEECKAKVVWVSTKEIVDGAYLQDGYLQYKNEKIIKESDMPIFGIHNVYNALTTIAVCKIMGVDSDAIKDAIKTFKGVKHRIELVATINGVNYYDDSKATNVASTITALDSMRCSTILILGGSEKGETYEKLFNKIKESPIKQVILTGSSRYNMLDSASNVGYSQITVTPDFDYAVKIAKTMAEMGDNVLLSPACASYDAFSNFEERGDRFAKLVKEQD